MLRTRHMTGVLTAVAALLAAAQSSAELAPLEPFQMVRSLQLVQDRIADGDHAALPMQHKLIELIDERLRASDREDYADGRNFRALLIYAMSGGNPRTVESIMASLSLEDTDARLATGVLEYLRGRPGEAANALASIDPREVASEVAAFLALVKGSVTANDDPETSLAFLDMARVMGPGTLVEEAALRRSAMLAITQRETGRFLLASEQYVRRFLRSPYASQFADAFVTGIAELHDTIDLERVAETIGGMNGEQAKVIYLRLARRAAIDQHTALLAFARGGLERMAAEVGSENDPRAILYSTVAAVTTDDVAEVRSQLESIDRRRLSAGDRMLLDAAMRIVTEVVSQPTAAAERAEEPHARAVAAAKPASATGDAYVDDARKRLDQVDRLLQETGQ